MKMDRNYFNSIHLRTFQRSYYDIGEVDELMVDIRKNAFEMLDEIDRLEFQLKLKTEDADNLKELLELTRTDNEKIISRAKAEAEEIIRDAKKKQAQIEMITNHEREALAIDIAEAVTRAQNQRDINEHEEDLQQTAPEDLSDKVKEIATQMQLIENDDGIYYEEEPEQLTMDIT